MPLQFFQYYHAKIRRVYDPVIVENVSYKGLVKIRKSKKSIEIYFLNIWTKRCLQTLGNNIYRLQIESKIKNKVGYNNRGRPIKS